MLLKGEGVIVLFSTTTLFLEMFFFCYIMNLRLFFVALL